MRGCLLSLLVALLILANGYTIWQVHLIRADLEKLRQETAVGRESGLASMLECARDAAEAIGRGETERAEAELDRLHAMVRDAGQMTQDQRQRLMDQVEAAKKAISRSAERAQTELTELIQMLSGRSDSEDD